jgi:hypothetical protein
MTLFRQSHFAAPGIRSLCWRGDELVDWVGGGRAFTVAGAERRANVSYGYRFDAATASPDGRFVVIYERLGTKGLLLRDGRIVRELDRSYYFADAYEFPVALFNAPDGRLVLAHCPGDYCRLELEEAETGRPLTVSTERKPADFFHSQLRASPGGKRLLSAGWLWHPLSLVACYDVAQALTDPQHLDDRHGLAASFNPGLVDESAACWLDDDHLAVAASAAPEQDSIEEDREPRLHPCGLAVYDAASRTCLSAFTMDQPPGTILPLGKGHVLSLYRNPKLIKLSTGKVVHVWTELSSGRQDGSIVWGLGEDAIPPAMAFDGSGGRFAIANGDAVTVLEFNLPALNAT